MTATHTAYPYGSKAHTSFVAYFQNIVNHMAGQRLISGCAVSRASASSLTVAAGSYTPATPETTAYAGATLSGIAACAASNHRYDLVYLDSADGTAKVATGTPAVPTNAATFLENIAPQPPDMPSETAILLAVICVDENGIRSGDNEGSVAGCADMRMTTNIGNHLASYLYVASQAHGDLMVRGASSWGRLGTSTIGKYLASGGAGADLAWADLLVGSLTCTSQARGDLVHRGATSWDRLAAGSANKYLMSNGTGNDLTYEDLKIGSLTVTSQAQGDIIIRGATTWGRLATGTVGQVLTSGGAGADLVWAAPAAAGASFWTAFPGTPARISDTSFSVTDVANANLYNLMYGPGTVIKWEKSGGGFQCAKITVAAYSSGEVLYTIVGNTLAAGFTDMKYCMHPCQEACFIVPGNLPASATTNIAKTIHPSQDIYIFSAVAKYTTAATTTKGVWDINDDGATIFTTKPEIAATAKVGTETICNSLLSTATTAIAQNSELTLDYDSGHATTPGADAYVYIFYMPLAWRYRA